MTDQQRMAFAAGRLYGLAGTVRYQVDPDMRIELKTIAISAELRQVPDTAEKLAP